MNTDTKTKQRTGEPAKRQWCELFLAFIQLEKAEQQRCEVLAKAYPDYDHDPLCWESFNMQVEILNRVMDERKTKTSP